MRITLASEPSWQAPLSVATLVFPGVTAIDYIGPATILGFFSEIHLCWKDTSTIYSDIGFPIQPTMSFADCIDSFDVLLVPGGAGTSDMLADQEVLAFLRQASERSKYITSVCTGSLILAAAGLLDGYKTAAYWGTQEILAEHGISVVKQRVVEDRNRFSGGGMTSGIDFGLSLLAKLRGEKAAKLAQLLIEYDPAPPFFSGSPEKAETNVLELATTILEPMRQAVNDGFERNVKARC